MCPRLQPQREAGAWPLRLWLRGRTLHVLLSCIFAHSELPPLETQGHSQQISAHPAFISVRSALLHCCSVSLHLSSFRWYRFHVTAMLHFIQPSTRNSARGTTIWPASPSSFLLIPHYHRP